MNRRPGASSRPSQPVEAADSTGSSELIAYVDGGARGNPGPAGYGVVIQDARGCIRETFSQFLGTATNNVAEYRGLLAALEYAAGQPAARLKVYCDSELMAKQMQGVYQVKSDVLKPLYTRARLLARQLSHFSIQHIPREQNARADRLANEAMDRGMDRELDREKPAPAPGAPSPAPSFRAVAEHGKLRPLAPSPPLQEGAEYEVRIRKLTPPKDPP